MRVRPWFMLSRGLDLWLRLLLVDRFLTSIVNEVVSDSGHLCFRTNVCARMRARCVCIYLCSPPRVYAYISNITHALLHSFTNNVRRYSPSYEVLMKGGGLRQMNDSYRHGFKR